MTSHQSRCPVFLKYLYSRYSALTETRIYPREIARRALALNAAAVIVAHNHPSGSPQPSDADIQITRQLSNTLSILDISLLDHCIIAAHQFISMAERGLL